MLYTNLRPSEPISYSRISSAFSILRFNCVGLLSVGGFPIDQDMDDPVVALWRQSGSGHG